MLLLGFAIMPSASADVLGWNGFLKQIGFGGSQVYEVSANGIILEGGQFTQVDLLCLDGDWPNEVENQEAGYRIEVNEPLIFDSNSGVTSLAGEITEDNTSRVFPHTVIGFRVFVEYFVNAPGTPAAPFDIPFTVTILCFSPSPLISVGGEWQPTDTTALLIGYSVLNAYWLAPTAVGIGVGIYLVKRKIE